MSDEIRGFTLHQPWASLVVRGIKKFETRSWKTNYTGLLLITSSRTLTDEGLNLEYLLCQKRVLNPIPNDRLPMQNIGLALGTVELVEVRPTDEIIPTQLENTVGDFGPGRFAWKLDNPVEFPKPFWIKGNRMLWHPNDDRVQRELRKRFVL